MEITVDIDNEMENFNEHINIEKIENYIKDVLKKEYSKDEDLYLSILLTNNERIQEINKEYRDKDSPTDVISFAYHEDRMDFTPYTTLGDIVISLERVEEQGVEYEHGFVREFYYVLTHGILHLLGYDHIVEEDKKVMREKEEEILNYFGYKRSLWKLNIHY